jgi:glutathione reductase (NADPH)
MTENKSYDLVVIGGGSGGVRAARWAAALGAKVAICEADRYGGTCVLRGCIPKKMMVYAGHFIDDIHTAQDYGLDIEVKGHNWNQFRLSREKELARLSGLYENMLTKNGVDIFEGHGTLIDSHTVKVGKQHLQAKNILIAVGGRPWRPQIVGAELGIDSNQFFQLEQRPDKVVINGGGFIGVEFACLLNHLGSEVHMVLRGQQILRGFDQETAKFLQESMQKAGIEFHFEEEIIKVEPTDSSKLVSLKKSSIEVDQVIFATGRQPMTQNLGLDKIGVTLDQNQAIIVNEYSQTEVPHIYAVGDVTNRMNLTPVALQEGMQVAEDLFNQTKIPMTYQLIPSAVFSSPPLATVGLTEEQAQQENLDIEVYTSSFRPLKYTLGPRQVRSFMKMIVDKKSKKVLGLHMVGDDAPEIMQGFAVALKAGATKEVFDQTIGIHPSSAEEFVTMRTPRA